MTSPAATDGAQNGLTPRSDRSNESEWLRPIHRPPRAASLALRLRQGQRHRLRPSAEVGEGSEREAGDTVTSLLCMSTLLQSTRLRE